MGTNANTRIDFELGSGDNGAAADVMTLLANGTVRLQTIL